MQSWIDFLDAEEKKLGKEATEKWLRSLRILKFDACNLYLEANDSFQINWFKEHISPFLVSRLHNSNGRPIKVHLNLPPDKTPQKPEENKQIKPDFSSDILESTAIFSQYYPGEGNKLPFQFLSELSTKIPLGSYNPIYIYGKEGVGKTHLLMALANSLIKQDLKVSYVKAETFTSHVIKAFRGALIDQFRKCYRHLDVLILDDIHLLANKKATQEEFFHTFNTLHTLNKQIILSADRAPSNLSEIEDRLISRFEWGITLPLQPLLQTELKYVVQKRLEMLRFNLSDEIITFLTQTFQHHSSLCRSVEALALRSHINTQDYTLETTKEALKSLIEEESVKRLNSEKLLEIVADFFNLTIEDLIGKSQKKEYVQPRQIAMYLFRRELKMPYLKIGKVFSRDHSTVMSSVKLIAKGIEDKNQDITVPLAGIVCFLN